MVIKADAQAATAWEHRVSPAVLQVWAAHVADPLIALDSTDVLQALAANPAALPNLQVGCSLPLLPCHWSCSGILAGHADTSRYPRLSAVAGNHCGRLADEPGLRLRCAASSGFSAQPASGPFFPCFASWLSQV